MSVEARRQGRGVLTSRGFVLYVPDRFSKRSVAASRVFRRMKRRPNTWKWTTGPVRTRMYA